MQAHNTSGAERRAQQATVKKQYAPKPAKNAQRSAPAADKVEVNLRKLTATVLDELKAPTAIPSVVILAALKKAREL